MRGIAFGFAVVAASWVLPAAAQKEEPVRGFEGACSADSVVAGKPFACDMLVYLRIDPNGSRAAVVFGRKGDGDSLTTLGGNFDASGNTLVLDGVQLKAGERTPFTGSCVFTRGGREIKAVRCEAIEADGQGRMVKIDFTVTSEIKS